MRAALGGAILGGAVAEGLPRAGVLLAVGVGAVLMVFGGASTRKIREFDDFPQPPEAATFGPWWEAAARAALPSTIGLTALGAVALGFSRGLAGVCGGLLVAMAILGAASGILLLLEERRERRRLYVDRGILQPHRFAGPPVSRKGPEANLGRPLSTTALDLDLRCADHRLEQVRLRRCRRRRRSRPCRCRSRKRTARVAKGVSVKLIVPVVAEQGVVSTAAARNATHRIVVSDDRSVIRGAAGDRVVADLPGMRRPAQNAERKG